MIFGKDEKKDKKNNHLQTMPLLPLRDIVVFPHMVVPLFVGREKSIKALEEAMARSNKEILLSAQKKAKTNDPLPEDIYEIGTIGHIIQLLKLPDGTVKVLVEGKQRAQVTKFLSHSECLYVECEECPTIQENSVELEALVRSVQTAFESYMKLNKRIPPEVLLSVQQIEDPERLADTISSHLTLKFQEKQSVLELMHVSKRLERLFELMQGEIEILQVEKKIRSRVKKQMEKTQKEYYLNEQMQAIQKELGERDEFKNEIAELEDKVKNKKMPKEAQAKARKEIKKLKMMSPMSAEATVVRNYIDWILSLPWGEYSQDKLDIVEAEKILNEDHYGLKKIKERIIEHLAVQAMVEKMKGPILCFIGPPGVGKTSLAKSIARATGRKFVRLSLGGVRDEAEIRGHRRTYIGALPGKIVQSLKKAGTSNPVLLLDEVDKMSMDFRGDPSAALLEVLDPEQNSTFNDHYLDLDYDLSRVMFICTANTLQSIPLPLQDRFEIINLAGYTEQEKKAIARRYLIPKETESCGLSAISIEWKTSAVRTIIQRYTREAGVRSLQREIASVSRKMARDVLKKGREHQFIVTPQRVKKWLGVPKFRHGQKEQNDQIGVVTGLAWTQVGGDLLQIEASLMPGKGKLMITGKLGDVMQESAQAAMSYVRSRCKAWGLPEDFYTKIDIHIHVPEGATPKDGPSAGITMATALVSALTNIAVKRDIAMTGEITLRGRVLPIGGLKEKALAAHRAGILTLVVPKENEKDLADIPHSIRKSLKIHLVEHIDEVLAYALVLDNPEEFKKRAHLATPLRLEMMNESPEKTPRPSETTRQ